MDEPLSSPERKSVKVTYSARRKRRNSVANYAEESSEEFKDDEDLKTEESGKVSVQKKGTTKTDGPKSTPKKADVMPPPASTKRPKDDATPAKKPVSKAKRKPDSSVSPVSNETKSTPNGNPVSTIGSRMTKFPQTPRAQSPDSMADDRSSIGESSKPSSRARKTEAERKEFLESDPYSGEVEPHRVFCTACKEWVQLNPKLRYIMRLWLVHRKECGKQLGNNEKDETELKSEVAPDEEDDNISVTPSEKSGTRRRGATATPSARVATAERKLKLVNDTQVKAFTPHSVECASCVATVTLDGEIEYDVTEWEKHKLICSGISPFVQTAEDALVPPASVTEGQDATRPPPSTASTDATMIEAEASPSRAGQKRSREDDSEDQRRSVRPRTKLYTAPEGDSPGIMDWIMLPFHNFVRGFREGLSSD
ncbi:hypothetical protein BKA93DRAFT_759405 [Sparassis latifolia]